MKNSYNHNFSFWFPREYDEFDIQLSIEDFNIVWSSCLSLVQAHKDIEKRYPVIFQWNSTIMAVTMNFFDPIQLPYHNSENLKLTETWLIFSNNFFQQKVVGNSVPLRILTPEYL